MYILALVVIGLVLVSVIVIQRKINTEVLKMFDKTQQITESLLNICVQQQVINTNQEAFNKDLIVDFGMEAQDENN